MLSICLGYFAVIRLKIYFWNIVTLINGVCCIMTIVWIHVPNKFVAPFASLFLLTFYPMPKAPSIHTFWSVERNFCCGRLEKQEYSSASVKKTRLFSDLNLNKLSADCFLSSFLFLGYMTSSTLYLAIVPLCVMINISLLAFDWQRQKENVNRLQLEHTTFFIDVMYTVGLIGKGADVVFFIFTTVLILLCTFLIKGQF